MGMRDAERLVLEELRKSSFQQLTEIEFDYIVKAVDTNGIFGLTGLTKTLVAHAMAKHGHHDQKTHGSWANGAGGMPKGLGTPDSLGFTPEHNIAHASLMFGTDSPRYKEAITRWGDSKHRGNDDDRVIDNGRNDRVGTIHTMSPAQAEAVHRIARWYTTGADRKSNGFDIQPARYRTGPRVFGYVPQVP